MAMVSVIRMKVGLGETSQLCQKFFTPVLQVPSGLYDDSGNAINKGKIYVSETSPPTVATAYLNQFQKDFNNLLKSRAAELVAGGRFVLFMLGQNHHHNHKSNTLIWDLLAQSLANMVSQKAIGEEKVDSYNLPLYMPSLKEIEDEVREEGAFTIDHAEGYEVVTSTGDHKQDAWTTSMTIRAGTEPMISQHFGSEDINKIFQNYCELLTEVLEKKELVKWDYLVANLRRLN